MKSEKAKSLRDAEMEYDPNTVWQGLYSSGLEQYENTFAGFGLNPIAAFLEKRREQGLKTTMYDVAASGPFIRELHHRGLIDFGISFTLVDPRKNLFSKIGDLLFNHSVIKTGDVVDWMTFFGLPKAQAIAFRPVGAFDDYPPQEFVRALSNTVECLDRGGVLFAQFPAHSDGNKIIASLNGSRWDAEVIQNGFRRSIFRNFNFNNGSLVSYPVARIQRK